MRCTTDSTLLFVRAKREQAPVLIQAAQVLDQCVRLAPVHSAVSLRAQVGVLSAQAGVLSAVLAAPELPLDLVSGSCQVLKVPQHVLQLHAQRSLVCELVHVAKLFESRTARGCCLAHAPASASATAASSAAIITTARTACASCMCAPRMLSEIATLIVSSSVMPSVHDTL